MEFEQLPGGPLIRVARAKAAREPNVIPFERKAQRTVEDSGDASLAEWAQWVSGNGNLGYPSQSITEKAREGGIAAGSPRPPTEMPEDVALTDRVIAAIRLRDKSILWRTIELIYLRRASMDALQRTLRISRSQSYRLLDRCRRAVYLGREQVASGKV